MKNEELNKIKEKIKIKEEMFISILNNEEKYLETYKNYYYSLCYISIYNIYNKLKDLNENELNFIKKYEKLLINRYNENSLNLNV